MPGAVLRSADLLRAWTVPWRQQLRVLRGLVGRQLLHLREEPVRANNVRRDVLADPRMHRARAVHWTRRVLMP